MKQKTPMQELLEWVRTTLPMDLETPRMIEQKIESLLEKEKEVMLQYGNDICCPHHGDENDALYVWNQTFKTKEK